MSKTFGRLTFGIDDHPFRRVLKVEFETNHWETAFQVSLWKYFAWISWEN